MYIKVKDDKKMFRLWLKATEKLSKIFGYDLYQY